ncbi:hypothetical protein [Streptomyces xiaopingdaonensis]|uniref:hypothetical protein n=1 Tax=Streptomyces xiaopingdaonensis TaxID=1565415 RepID=UPI000D0AAEAC|nr:hypothetical protein [Streptomyces xiaopingdaonensis]
MEASAHEGRRRRPSRPGAAVLGAVAGIAVTVTAVAVLWWPRADVVQESRAPADVEYADGSRHHLALVEERTLSGRETYRLVVGRDPGHGYGHHVDLGSGVAAEGIESAEWTAAGVRVQFGTGHRVFVPASLFVGGR